MSVTPETFQPRRGAGHRQARLLEIDPELGLLLDPARAAEARQLVVRLHPLDAGAWAGEQLSATGPEHLGLLLVGGILAREVVLADNVSCELLGPGDVVRPWSRGTDQLLRAEVRWTALEPGEMAILDRRLAAQLARFPEISAMVVDRIAQRNARLALSQAISQLNGVDRRLLALFWHLAERWGRITRDGVLVPVPLPHRILAQLVGARRPTVSTALGVLVERGELERHADGSWLLLGDPVGVPTDEAARVIRRRRGRFERAAQVARGEAAQGAPAEEGGGDEPRPVRGDLHAAVEQARQASRRNVEDYRALRTETGALIERLAEARRRRAEDRAPQG